MFILPSDNNGRTVHSPGTMNSVKSVSSSARIASPSSSFETMDSSSTTYTEDDDDDASSTPSTSFELPSYLSSPSTSPTRRSKNCSSPSSRSGKNRSPKMEDQQRLVLLAKFPNANEHQVEQTLKRQKRQQEAAAAASKRKGQQFRMQQQQQKQKHEENHRLSNCRREQQTTVSTVTQSSKRMQRINLNECSSSDDEGGCDHEELQIVFQTSAGQGSGEGSYSGPQRIAFHERELPPPPEEEPVYYRERKSIMGWAVATFTKIFPSDSSSSPPSSGASIQSGSMDGRSIANKSLPSYSSEQTRKVNNLSNKSLQARKKKMNSIHEDDDGNSLNARNGIFRCMSTRNGLIICALILILIIAIIVTVGAALRQQGQESAPGSPSPTSPEMTFPTMLPASVPTKESSSAPTSSGGGSIPSPPTPPPSTLQATNAPTSTPTTLLPSSPPTAAPTAVPFSDWAWTQRGQSFQGGESNERFGQTLALSQDGRVVAIGAPSATDQTGFVEVFHWDDGESAWIPRGVLEGRTAGDQFGSNIAMSSDGQVLAVSEPTYRGRPGDRSGNVRVFIYSPFNGYSPLGQEIEGEDATDHTGIGLALSDDGRRLAVGAPYHDNTNGNGNGNGNNRLVSGNARIYEWTSSDGMWTPIGEPLKGIDHLDWFGWSVDLNSDGSVVCIGAPRNLEYGGYVQCFEETVKPGNSDSGWSLIGDTISNALKPVRFDDNFGTAVRVSADSSGSRFRVAIGSPGKNTGGVDTGISIVYEFDPREESQGWSQLGKAIVSPNPNPSDQLGSSLDIQGDLLAVGVPGDSQVNLYRFQEASNEWELHLTTLTGFDESNFGIAVRLTNTGDVAVGSATDIGSATVYSTDSM